MRTRCDIQYVYHREMHSLTLGVNVISKLPSFSLSLKYNNLCNNNCNNCVPLHLSLASGFVRYGLQWHNKLFCISLIQKSLCKHTGCFLCNLHHRSLVWGCYTCWHVGILMQLLVYQCRHFICFTAAHLGYRKLITVRNTRCDFLD